MDNPPPTPGRITVMPMVLAVLLAVILTALFLRVWLAGPGTVSSNRVELSDGSVFELKETAFAKGYQYHHRSPPAWLKLLAPVIPDALEDRMPGAMGGFGFGGSGTNLILITVFDKAAPQSRFVPERLRIRDDDGNAFDSNWGANTLGMNQLLVHGWEAPAFPRRSPTLTAQFLCRNEQNEWVELASFPIENPAYPNGGTWRPQALPASRREGDLAIRLLSLQSGATLAEENLSNALSPRFTRMRFEFEVEGRPSDEFNIQKVTLSDASGNHWSPYLNLLNQTGRNFAQGGVVQFLGALWPGENAWKIEVEAYRTRGHDGDVIWDAGPLAVPEDGKMLEMTNTFSVGETTLRLANILAPGVQTKNEWQWIVRYWGNDSSVYPVGLHAVDGLNGRRVVLLEAENENGESIELLEHRRSDQDRQALFLKVPPGSTNLRLKLALPEIKRAEFLARPDFDP